MSSKSSSYEQHATTLIHCATVAVYAYMLSMFATTSMLTVALIAKLLPPIDSFSLTFDVLFMCTVVLIFRIAVECLYMLFFSDYAMEKNSRPVFENLNVQPDGTTTKLSFFKPVSEVFPSMASIMSNLMVSKAPPQLDGNTTTTTSATTATNDEECVNINLNNNTFPPGTPSDSSSNDEHLQQQQAADFSKQCPGTPDSELSQAGTAAAAENNNGNAEIIKKMTMKSS